MQFETIAITIFALALLVFLYTRRRIITDLKEQNEKLQKYVIMLTDVGNRQRDEITKLIDTAEQERRARQMATLTSRPAPRAPITKPPEWKDPDLARDPYKNTRAASRSMVASKQEEATRRRTQDQAPANTWTDPGIPYKPAASPAPAPAPAYHGGGGSFDGGGASGDYGRSDSCSSSSSSSSDSGSSSSCSSSDSGSSSSSSD